jgi:hypothetical protein
MDIKFNPSRSADAPVNQPVARQNNTTPATSAASFEKAQSLERTISELPLVRPEKVAHARALVADSKYPPNEMLDRIASLLALHIEQ